MLHGQVPGRAGADIPPDPSSGSKKKNNKSSGSSGSGKNDKNDKSDGGSSSSSSKKDGKKEQVDPDIFANAFTTEQNKGHILKAMLERARFFANSQLGVQRVVFGKEICSMCYQMPTCESAYQHLIQPFLSKLAWDSDADVRRQILLQFGDLSGFLIQSNPDVGYAFVLASLVPVFPTLLLDPNYKETRQEAADSLLVLSSHLRLQERTDYALRTVLSLSNDQDEEARSLSAYLLNGLAPTLTRELCVEFCAIQLLALAEDPKAGVRKSVLINLKDVAQCAGEKFCQTRLLDTYRRLCSDTNYTVRRCAAEQLPLMVEWTHQFEECISIAMKLHDDTNKMVHLSLCQHCGYILVALQKFGGNKLIENADNKSKIDQLIDAYFKIMDEVNGCDLVEAGEMTAYKEVKYQLGYTFSAVLESVLPYRKDLVNKFHVMFEELCEVTDERTRRCMACSLPKIYGILLRSAREKEVSEIDKFGKSPENSGTTAKAAIKQSLSEIFLQFTTDKDDIKIGLSKNISLFDPSYKYPQALGQMATKSDNWRLRHTVASLALPQLCEKYSNKNIIFNYVFPTYLKLLHDGVQIVRSKAATSTNVVLKAVCPEAHKGYVKSNMSEVTASHNISRSASSASSFQNDGGRHTHNFNPDKRNLTSGNSTGSTSVVLDKDGKRTHNSATATTIKLSPIGIDDNSKNSLDATNTPPSSRSGNSEERARASGQNSTGETSGKTLSVTQNALEVSPNPSLHVLGQESFHASSYYCLRSKRIVNHIRKTFKDGSFQNKITFVKMCDSLIRDSSVSRKFVHLFLNPLADLANDKVRNVRLQWAIMIGPHIKRGIGKCCYHRKLVAAGLALKDNKDDEIRRRLNFNLGDLMPLTVSQANIASGSNSVSPHRMANGNTNSSTKESTLDGSFRLLSSGTDETDFSDTDSLNFSMSPSMNSSMTSPRSPCLSDKLLSSKTTRVIAVDGQNVDGSVTSSASNERIPQHLRHVHQNDISQNGNTAGGSESTNSDDLRKADSSDLVDSSDPDESGPSDDGGEQDLSKLEKMFEASEKEAHKHVTALGNQKPYEAGNMVDGKKGLKQTEVIICYTFVKRRLDFSNLYRVFLNCKMYFRNYNVGSLCLIYILSYQADRPGCRGGGRRNRDNQKRNN